MKTLKITLITFLAVVATFNLHAQTSNLGFNFQGYAIDPDGKAMAGESVTVQFTVNASKPAKEYKESHVVDTDNFGVFHALIGQGTKIGTTNFTDINFNNFGNASPDNIVMLKVEVKKGSSGSFVTISNEPFSAVPFAQSASNGVPPGTIMAYGGETVPAGWLLCDGTPYAKTAYPFLSAAIGTAWGGNSTNFHVPDLRGRFLRGVDGGAGNDPDRATRFLANTGGNTGDNVGSLQGEQTKSHNHNFNDPGHHHEYMDIYFSEQSADPSDKHGSGLLGLKGDSDNDNVGYQLKRPTLAPSGTYGKTNISFTAFGGNETRPVNAAVKYIIKY